MERRELTHEELKALAGRLYAAWDASPRGEDAFKAVAREAIRYFAERRPDCGVPPPLPEPDALGPFSGSARIAYTPQAVARIRDEAYEAGLRASTSACAAEGVSGADQFTEWLKREMPANTIIGDPAWWANLIARRCIQFIGRARPATPQAAHPEPEEPWLDRLKWATERRLTRDYRTVTLSEHECRQVLSALATPQAAQPEPEDVLGWVDASCIPSVRAGDAVVIRGVKPEDGRRYAAVTLAATQAAQVPVAVVTAYLAARDELEEAERPGGGFATPVRMLYGDARVVAYREARTALRAAVEHAKLSADDARLPCDVQVGGGVFRAGVPVRLVLDAIERQRNATKVPEADIEAMRAALPGAAEVLGTTCADGGACHHGCDEIGLGRCFRRTFASPLAGYTGPWAYPKAGEATLGRDTTPGPMSVTIGGIRVSLCPDGSLSLTLVDRAESPQEADTPAPATGTPGTAWAKAQPSHAAQEGHDELPSYDSRTDG